MLDYSSSNPTQGTSFFFFYTHILSGSCSQPYFGQFFYLVCRYLEKKKKKKTAGVLYIEHVVYRIRNRSSGLETTK